MKASCLRALAFGLSLTVVFAARLTGDDLGDLARDFWAWRAATQPVSGDDVPRVERPAGWTPDWSRAAIEARRQKLAEFEKRWRGIDPSGMPVPWQVDRRLMGSAIARVRWELEVLRSWERDPTFYVDQTLGAYFESLLRPPPLGRERSAEIVRHLESIPQTVASAKANLRYAIGPFARLAAERLKEVRAKLLESVRAVKPLLARESQGRMDEAAAKALRALEPWREWLDAAAPTLPVNSAVGREGYLFFLREVALLPFTPEELVAMGRQEWARAVSLEAMEQTHNRGAPALPVLSDLTALIRREEKDEEAIRRFLEEKRVLSVPSWVGRYRFRPMPAYLAPLASFGEADDLTSLSRLKENAVRYIEEPSPKSPYFEAATARDPRPSIVHEGVPGHFFQLVLSWSHEDSIRRHYYDSGPNEGLAFYAEEMMMQTGLFDDSPRTREIIASFLRLRALRVEVDVKLALGEFTIEKGTEYLEKAVPMDRPTARSEAAFFASNPGQAVSYEIGKLQILRLLADARGVQGEAFDLRAFHDFVWKNGNVPLSLQRWEYLGFSDEINRLGHPVR
jgi:uncharacterized protein (DUF885 family)